MNKSKAGIAEDDLECWEYLSKDNCTDGELNSIIGTAGWELVAVTLSEYNNRRFYFKRKVK